MNQERRYHSPLRAELYQATRARIVRAAAAEHGALELAAVARRAGVSERTVYRHFPTMAALDEARLAALEADAGWPEGDVAAPALPELTRRAFLSFARHRGAAEAGASPLAEARAARRRQLATALRPLGGAREHVAGAAALVGLLSSGEGYRQLVDHWGLDGRAAAQAAAWAVHALLAALAREEQDKRKPPSDRRKGHTPPDGRKGRAPGRGRGKPSPGGGAHGGGRRA